MINLVRLGNKTVSNAFPSLEVNKNNMKLNVIACTVLGAVPGKSRIDVAVDGDGETAKLFITVINPDPNNPDSEKEGRALSKTSSFNSSSIKATLDRFNAEVFEIKKENPLEFEGLKWYALEPKVAEKKSTGSVTSAVTDEEIEEEHQSFI